MGTINKYFYELAGRQLNIASDMKLADIIKNNEKVFCRWIDNHKNTTIDPYNLISSVLFTLGIKNKNGREIAVDTIKKAIYRHKNRGQSK